MQWYKADLHIHTVLSPCGGLDMSPVNIVKEAAGKNLAIIGITDHNSTKHCHVAREIGKKYGILVLAGAEINTREEIHCLTFFEDMDKANLFQQYIDRYLMVVNNKPEVFGNQFIVDEEENILEEESRLLIASLSVSIDDAAKEVHRLGGLFIPAHINRMSNSLYSQLGFLPPDLSFDALEIYADGQHEDFIAGHPEISGHSLVTNSDAHDLNRLGIMNTSYFLDHPDWEEIKSALKNENGRRIRRI